MVILENAKPGTFLIRNAPKSLNEKLKYAIPSSSRIFTEDGWVVQETYISQVEYWLNKYNIQYTRNSTTTNKEEYYKVLHLLPTAPDVIVDAVWKVLARKYHPDTIDGDNETFIAVKQAYEAIRGK